MTRHRALGDTRLEAFGLEHLDVDGICVDYDAADAPIRADLQLAHRAVLAHVASPGSWLTGAERVAIAAESRAADRCRACRTRKAALSPERPAGEHARATDLPDAVVEIAHRLRTDPGRLSRGWFDRQLAAGLSDAEYVEIVGVVALVAGLDAFCVAAGLDPFALPEPRPGEPSRRRPENVEGGAAWVPILAPEDAVGPEADLYPASPMVPNIVRALSLVPQHVRVLRLENESHYIPLAEMTRPDVGRDLDRMQIELVAARVSALNECFY